MNSCPGILITPEADFEERVLDFERAWQSDKCDIARLLDRSPALEGEGRRELLVELVCVDLEFRWRDRSRKTHSQEGAFLEDYAARLPELGPIDRLPLEVIGQEYRARRQWGDRPTHSIFLARFTTRRERLRAELGRIDRELREESAAPAGTPSRLAEAPVGEPDGDVHPGFPLISHHDVQLRRMIGSGGMGKVYEAWWHGLGRPVAVKFLRKSLLPHSRVVERFIAEAVTIGRLAHPNIVGTLGLGRTTGGAYFIVMELVDGPNLDFIIKQRVVPAAEAVRWGVAVCDALEYAHSKGVVHCDLKPANLLLGPGGRLRVADFGLSRSLADHDLWADGLEGTAPFMAPEQASGCWGRIDARTDVYGVGAVLFTLLTGRPPWVGRRLPDVLADVIGGAPVVSPVSLRPDLPGPLGDVIPKCLSKPPDGRYATVQELRSALAGIIV